MKTSGQSLWQYKVVRGCIYIPQSIYLCQKTWFNAQDPLGSSQPSVIPKAPDKRIVHTYIHRQKTQTRSSKLLKSWETCLFLLFMFWVCFVFLCFGAASSCIAQPVNHMTHRNLWCHQDRWRSDGEAGEEKQRFFSVSDVFSFWFGLLFFFLAFVCLFILFCFLLRWWRKVIG